MGKYPILSQHSKTTYVNSVLATENVADTKPNSLDCKETKPVSPKGNQPSIFTGRTDAEVPIFGPPDTNSQLIVKDLDAGKD